MSLLSKSNKFGRLGYFHLSSNRYFGPAELNQNSKSGLAVNKLSTNGEVLSFTVSTLGVGNSGSSGLAGASKPILKIRNRNEQALERIANRATKKELKKKRCFIYK